MKRDDMIGTTLTMRWMASLARTRGLSLGLAVVMLLGAGVRLFLYAYNPSLTEDEVSVSLNIAMRGYAPAAVLHSNEVKPYAGDLLVTATLIWLSAGRRSVPGWIAAGVGGLLLFMMHIRWTVTPSNCEVEMPRLVCCWIKAGLPPA